VTFPGLCAWVINIIKFYEVYCDVEPKRQALFQANADLAAAQEKLSIIKRKVVVSVLCLISSFFVFCNKEVHWAVQ
jgi:hypothetical protein